MLLACSMGFIEIVKILLNDPRTDESIINMQTIFLPETALSRACRGDCTSSLEIAALLLNHPNIDPNISETYHVIKISYSKKKN